MVEENSTTGLDLTNMQRRFCQEYIIDLNQGAAYKRAGYNVKNDNTAWACASKLLRNAKVKNYISELQMPMIQKSKSIAEKAIKELENHAFSDIGHFINTDGKFMTLKEIKELAPQIRRTIESVEETKYGLKIRLVKKLPALELLGKHLSLFTEKTEHPDSMQDYLKTLTDEELQARCESLEKVVRGMGLI